MFLIQSETIFELEYVFLVYATEKYFHVFLLLCVTFSTWAFSSLLFPFFFIVGLISFLFLSFNFAYEHALLANYYLFFFLQKLRIETGCSFGSICIPRVATILVLGI